MLAMLAAALTPGAAAQSPPPRAATASPPTYTLPPRATIAPAIECADLARRNFARTPGAPADVTEARIVPRDGDAAEHCLVSGYVAPQVRFQLRLPTTGYTGRYLQIGCGGNCGFIRLEATPRCDDAMARSGAFAVAATDAGHAAPPSSTLWARDNRALQEDFAERAVHVTAIAAKAIVAAYYGKAPERSYFQGCSDGGREAMKEAQRYPEDFDGIVAGAPANYIASGFLRFAWQEAANRGTRGAPILTKSAGETLHAAVMAACDGLDGLVDGQIDRPRACTFDPARIACPGGGAEQPGKCISAAQIATARAFYSGPVDAAGRHLWLGGLAYGSELTWATSGRVAAVEGYFSDMLYGAKRPQGVRLADIQFTTATLREVMALGAHYDAYDPDIRRFRDRGGRMIVWEGAADPSAGPNATLNYYQTVRDTLGGLDRTRETMRTFILPGVYHCRGGYMPYEANFLGAIVTWVETGKAPDAIVAAAAKPDGGVRTRPIPAYPDIARYRGSGSMDDAANFDIVPPAREPDDRFDWAGQRRK